MRQVPSPKRPRWRSLQPDDIVRAPELGHAALTERSPPYAGGDVVGLGDACATQIDDSDDGCVEGGFGNTPVGDVAPVASEVATPVTDSNDGCAESYSDLRAKFYADRKDRLAHYAAAATQSLRRTVMPRATSAGWRAGSVHDGASHMAREMLRACAPMGAAWKAHLPDAVRNISPVSFAFVPDVKRTSLTMAEDARALRDRIDLMFG